MKKPRYYVEDRDRHGNVRGYTRLDGMKIRVRAFPPSAAFWAEHEANVNTLRDRRDGKAPLSEPDKNAALPPGSLGWLIGMYYASAKFLQLDPATQRLRRGVLEQIRTRPAGRKPYKLMEPRHVAELRDEKVDAPTQANKIVMYLRYVFDWAMKEEVALATRNPTTNVEMLETKPGGIHAWTVDEVEAFEARHPIGTKARLAFALLLYLGVRRSDVIRLGRQQLRTVRNADGEAEQWITFDVFKGRKRNPKSLTLPILPELQAIIDATPSTNMTFLVTEQGKPFTNGYFGNWFKGRCREAGLGKCSAHGLRKAGASFAAEGGATERQLMALYGWDSKNEPERYTRSARQKELAGDGMPSLTRGRNKNKSVPPSATVSAGGTFRRKKP